MITYQLKCSTGHEFEAWFRNSAGYDEQQATGDISCPMCGDQEIMKALMAPSVGKKGNASVSSHEARASEVAREVLDAVDTIRKHVEDSCDYVGTDFADEARKIHYGETEERGIYGEATQEDNQALDEEGIEVFRIPTPPRRDS
jgi:hypothetical protein